MIYLPSAHDLQNSGDFKGHRSGASNFGFSPSVKRPQKRMPLQERNTCFGASPMWVLSIEVKTVTRCLRIGQSKKYSTSDIAYLEKRCHRCKSDDGISERDLAGLGKANSLSVLDADPPGLDHRWRQHQAEYHPAPTLKHPKAGPRGQNRTQAIDNLNQFMTAIRFDLFKWAQRRVPMNRNDVNRVAGLFIKFAGHSLFPPGLFAPDV
jgi:hypothetical protein